MANTAPLSANPLSASPSEAIREYYAHIVSSSGQQRPRPGSSSRSMARQQPAQQPSACAAPGRRDGYSSPQRQPSVTTYVLAPLAPPPSRKAAPENAVGQQAAAHRNRSTTSGGRQQASRPSSRTASPQRQPSFTARQQQQGREGTPGPSDVSSVGLAINAQIESSIADLFMATPPGAAAAAAAVAATSPGGGQQHWRPQQHVVAGVAEQPVQSSSSSKQTGSSRRRRRRRRRERSAEQPAAAPAAEAGPARPAAASSGAATAIERQGLPPLPPPQLQQPAVHQDQEERWSVGAYGNRAAQGGAGAVMPVPPEPPAKLKTAMSFLDAGPEAQDVLSPVFMSKKRRPVVCEMDEPGSTIIFPRSHRQTGPLRRFLASMFACFVPPPDRRSPPPSVHTRSSHPSGEIVDLPAPQLCLNSSPLRHSLAELRVSDAELRDRLRASLGASLTSVAGVDLTAAASSGGGAAGAPAAGTQQDTAAAAAAAVSSAVEQAEALAQPRFSDALCRQDESFAINIASPVLLSQQGSRCASPCQLAADMAAGGHTMQQAMQQQQEGAVEEEGAGARRNLIGAMHTKQPHRYLQEQQQHTEAPQWQVSAGGQQGSPTPTWRQAEQQRQAEQKAARGKPAAGARATHVSLAQLMSGDRGVKRSREVLGAPRPIPGVSPAVSPFKRRSGRDLSKPAYRSEQLHSILSPPKSARLAASRQSSGGVELAAAAVEALAAQAPAVAAVAAPAAVPAAAPRLRSDSASMSPLRGLAVALRTAGGRRKLPASLPAEEHPAQAAVAPALLPPPLQPSGSGDQKAVGGSRPGSGSADQAAMRASKPGGGSRPASGSGSSASTPAVEPRMNRAAAARAAVAQRKRQEEQAQLQAVMAKSPDKWLKAAAAAGLSLREAAVLASPGKSARPHYDPAVAASAVAAAKQRQEVASAAAGRAAATLVARSAAFAAGEAGVEPYSARKPPARRAAAAAAAPPAGAAPGAKHRLAPVLVPSPEPQAAAPAAAPAAPASAGIDYAQVAADRDAYLQMLQALAEGVTVGQQERRQLEAAKQPTLPPLPADLLASAAQQGAAQDGAQTVRARAQGSQDGLQASSRASTAEYSLGRDASLHSEVAFAGAVHEGGPLRPRLNALYNKDPTPTKASPAVALQRMVSMTTALAQGQQEQVAPAECGAFGSRQASSANETSSCAADRSISFGSTKGVGEAALQDGSTGNVVAAAGAAVPMASPAKEEKVRLVRLAALLEVQQSQGRQMSLSELQGAGFSIEDLRALKAWLSRH